MKHILIIFIYFSLLISPLFSDFGAPPYNGKGFILNGKNFPSLFFIPTTTNFGFHPFGKVVEGRWRILLILVNYSDYPTSESYRENLFVQSTPTYFHDMIMGGNTYPFRSMNDFYLEMSHGRFGLQEADVYGWYTLPHTRQYYACNGRECDAENGNGFQKNKDYWTPVGALDLVEDAITEAMKDNPDLDLNLYDNDGDGIPESIFIIHAGEGGESNSDPLCIWSHRNTMPLSVTEGRGFQGTITYVMGPEMFSTEDTMPIRMGVFAHEFGHALDLPDLYDTDYSSCGDGPYSLMAYGVHTGNPPGSNPYPLDAWLKMKLGWVYPIDITINTCGRIIYPIQISNVVYRYNPDPKNGTEYFLIDFRQDYGFDHEMFSDLAPHWKGAVYIWHVDESKGNGYLCSLCKFPYNTQECVPGGDEDCSKYHYALSLEQADGLFQLERTPAGGGCAVPDWGDLYHTGDVFSIDTTPNSDLWSGDPSNLTVEVVKVTDNYAKVNFVIDPNFTLSPPEIFSIPKTSIEEGKLYQYKVRASGYGLSFELVEGPKGMKINPVTGVITWQTTENDIGNHKVTVKVENCGGEDEQDFILVVYKPPAQGCSCKSGGSVGDFSQGLVIFLSYLLFKRKKFASEGGE